MKNSVGKILKHARENKGLSQLDVSKKFGFTSPQFISNIERGLVNVPPTMVGKYSRVIGISPDTLVNAMVDRYREKIVANL